MNNDFTRLKKGVENLYLYIKRVKARNKYYRYLVVEEYDKGRRKVLAIIPVKKAAEIILSVVRGVGFEPTQAYAIGSLTRNDSCDNSSVSGVVSEKLSEFLRWCVEERGTSRETCEQYMRYLRKPFNPNNKWSRLAWKAFYKFTGNEEAWKSIKLKPSGVDLYVPSADDVLRTLKEAEEPFRTIYWVLLQSGIRLKEATYLVSNIDKLRVVSPDGFYRVELGLIRGSKQAFWAYLIELPKQVKVHDNAVSKYAQKRGLIPPKYIRKFAATMMASLEIPESVINFIQGRAPKEVLTRHYLSLLSLADKYYPRYAEWVKQSFQHLI